MSPPPAARPGLLARALGHPMAGGAALALATLLALVVSNSPWAPSYESLLQMRGEVRIGEALRLSKPLVLWVNDLWMAVFFFLVGLEIKRELVEGELASPRKAMLPAAAALGGMAVPALIYSAVNAGDAVALRGWAIPAATDIAFALGVVTLLGRRVPASLKIFLTAVAIIDDLGAIVVIALFYSDQLSMPMLGAGLAGAAVLLALNRAWVTRVEVYAVVGLIVWVCVLKSGVHATLAGVITALALPLRTPQGQPLAPRVEHALAPWVAFAVLPLFAFLNAGVSLAGMTPAWLVEPVALGVAAALVLGKTVGVFGSVWLLVRLRLGEMPAAAGPAQLLGVCVLCGIGFTMSLFIGSLAFEGMDPRYEARVKLGVLGGSLISALLGAAILSWAARARRPAQCAAVAGGDISRSV